MSNNGKANPIGMFAAVLLIGVGVWFFYGSGLDRLLPEKPVTPAPQVEKADALPSTEAWIRKLHKELPYAQYFGSAGDSGFPVGIAGERGKALFNVMGQPTRTLRQYGVIQFEFRCSDGTVVIDANAQVWDGANMLSVLSVNTFPN